MQHNPHDRARDRTPIAYAVIAVTVLTGGIFGWLAWTMPGDLAIFFRGIGILALAGIALGLVGLYNQWASHRAAGADKLIKLADKQRALPAGVQSVSWHDSHKQLPPPEQQVIEAPAEDLPALPLTREGTSRLEQLRQLGHICRSGNSMLTGYSEGKPTYIELPECGFVGIGGQPRTGKSSTSLLLIEQAVLTGWHVFVGDPHVQKADGLLSRCKPFSGRLARQAVTPDEIADLVRYVDRIGRARVNGDRDRTPCILVLDEFSNLVWRDMLPADVLGILPSMAAEYAGVGVHGILIAHDWSKASLGGDLGAALRRAITHRIIHRMDAGNVEFLLPKGSSAQARAVASLDVGRALYWGPEGAAMVAVPWLGEDDARYASQGTPEQPYAPRQPAQLRATAPTMPLLVTVQDQITGLLIARPWLSSTEIAAALNIDVKVIRTEVAAMKKRLDRRETPKGSADRFAYAVRQPVNQSTGP